MEELDELRVHVKASEMTGHFVSCKTIKSGIEDVCPGHTPHDLTACSSCERSHAAVTSVNQEDFKKLLKKCVAVLKGSIFF